ncbi:hypothetical protein F5Y02DRAFT_426249 [Annulohypoxylon stygium]|nr:hypothetical protein F5Y02DRAFT_426249 [Annulohypoxylon stygium]
MKKHHGPNYTPPDTTDSPAAWELCRAWINKCIETHDKCKSFQTESPDPSKLPTRLLYIASLGYNNLSEDHLNSLNIQIHITKEKGIKGSYMTLSHCWGDAGGILKLTNKNYKQWIETGFPYKDLPKTFQDAVRLSLFLRNDYLWVDSLCIIQSPDPSDLDTKSDAEVANGDWIRESKTMTDVYRYSKCNIAATASRGPTEGCFYSRKHPITKVSPLEIRLGQERYLFMSDSLIETNVDDAPLDKRAWVLQERILAPRQINCCRFQLSWECQESLACETFPFIYEPHVEFDVQSNVGPLKMHSMPLTLLEVEYLRFSKEKLDMFPGCRNCDYNIHQYQNTESFSKEISQVQKTLAQLKGATRNEWIAHAIFHLYNEWTFIVEGYSKRTLSYRNDKLVAIDGIASRMRDVLQGLDEYVAGLWRSQLHWQLLWQTELFKDSDNMPINTNDMSSRYDIGPSWSWANIDTGVGWDNRIPFDEASKSIFTIDILEVYDRHTVTKNDTISSAKESPLTVRCLLCKFSKRETLAKIGGFDVGMWMDTKMDDAEKHKLLGQSFIMVVSYKINGDDNPTISVNGLIVSPCEGRPGFYMRIGYCVFFLVHDLFQDFKGAVKEDREDITLI